MTDSGLITSFNSASNSSSSSSVSGDTSSNSSSPLTKSASTTIYTVTPTPSTDTTTMVVNSTTTPSVKTIAKSYETNILPSYSKPKLFVNSNEVNFQRPNSIIKIINGTKSKIAMPTNIFENTTNSTGENKSRINKPSIAKYSRHATVNIMSEAPKYETSQLMENRATDDIQVRNNANDFNGKISSIKDDSKSIYIFFIF